MTAGRRMDKEFLAWLEHRRDHLRTELSKCQAALTEVELNLAIAKGGVPSEATNEPPRDEARERMPRGAIKSHVIRIVTDNTIKGVAATDLVDLAKAQGITLNRGSVSSLLSKLKEDGVLDYDKDAGKYRLASSGPPKQPPSGAGIAPAGVVLHAPAT